LLLEGKKIANCVGLSPGTRRTRLDGDQLIEFAACRRRADATADKAALGRVATVTEQNGCTKVVKRPDCAMEDLEPALFPILPIESARLTLQRSPGAL